MTRYAVSLIWAAGIVAGTCLFAQAPPNFTGTWRLVSSPDTQPDDMAMLTIAQTAGEVKIGPISDKNPDSLTITLDGTESRNIIRGPGTPVDVLSRATWDGPRLVVSDVLTTSRGTMTVKSVYSLERGRLIRETGGTSQNGSTMPLRTTTYIREEAVALPPAPVRTVEPGYTNLFNGRDLTDWKIGGPPSFTVANGAIVAHGASSHLFYDGSLRNHAFRNFDLKLDVLARNRSNGGVYISTEYQAQGFPATGFEIQLNNSHTDRSRSGSLYHVVDLSYVPAKDDEWFPMEIMVSGATITITVKGNQVIRWTQPADWNGSYDWPGRKIAPGTIAFQSHDPNSTTAYANIRIRPLD
jgi:hypothetical protein